MIKRLIVTVLVLLPSIALADVLGTVGMTYPFAEPDALSEVTERAKQLDWKRLFTEAAQKGRHFKPSIPDLPRAGSTRKRQVGMSYTLDVDVPDPKSPSRILYPKGFVFNPLQFMTMPACVVFVNAADRAQRDWLISSQQGRDLMTPILLTGGDVDKIEKALKRPVYYADQLLLERFGVEAVPSVACQNGALLELEEIDVRKTAH